MKARFPAWKYFLLVIVLAVLSIMAMDFNSRMANLRRLTSDQTMVENRLISLQQTQVWLSSQVDYANSDTAVERWAYLDGQMVRNGDILVVPLESAKVTATPKPVTVPEKVHENNLDEWTKLFLGAGIP